MSDLISRADAIDAIDDAIDADSPQWAILRTKIGFLPSAELPKGELISRADAIERIVNDNVVGGMDRVNEYRNSNEHNDYLDGISCAIATVDDLPSAEAESDDLIIKGAKGIKDGLYNIKDRKLFQYKANGGTVRTYPIVEALPSAEAEWIPVSERLPEDGQGVLVTVDANKWNIEVGSCIYSGGTFQSKLYDLDVIAWMPLPKPYKEESEVEE